MSKDKIITQLTSEQEALIPVYREKWRKIALSTERIDRQKAAEAVKAAYTLINLPEPEILFYDSPYAVGSDRNLLIDEDRIYGGLYKYRKIGKRSFPYHLLSFFTDKCEYTILSRLEKNLKNRLREEFSDFIENQLSELFSQITDPVRNQLWNELESRQKELEKLWQERWTQLGVPNAVELCLWTYWEIKNAIQIDDPLINYISKEWDNLSKQEEKLNITFGNNDIFITPYQWVSSACLYNFSINVLNSRYKQKEWEILQSVAINCGILFTFEKMVILCERPTKLSFDHQSFLHAEAEPAIEFADEFKMYAYHGVRLPEKYRIHSQQWQAQWFLEEDNAELRRVLIQGIGYSRICQELQAVELDSWQEYTLLKIDLDVDVEPIYLLKMICPSTSYIHALRVPPNMTSAREAICWVNWGVDPEEFSVQT